MASNAMSSNESLLSFFHFRRSGRRIDSQETLILGETDGETDGDTELLDTRPAEFDVVPDRHSNAELAALFPSRDMPDEDMSSGASGPVEDGNNAVDPKPKKLTNKEKAAMGANRVGIWTRHRALCPHDRQISVDLWKPDHCSWVKELNHDIASVANKFKKCRPNRAEFFSLLVVVLVLSPPTNRGSYDPIFEMVNHSICNW